MNEKPCIYAQGQLFENYHQPSVFSNFANNVKCIIYTLVALHIQCATERNQNITEDTRIFVLKLRND